MSLFLCQIVGVVTTLLMSVGGLPREPHPKHSSQFAHLQIFTQSTGGAEKTHSFCEGARE